MYYLLKASICLIVIGFFLAAGIPGCNYPLSEKKREQISLPPEKIHQIDALHLPVSTEPDRPYDPNQILAPREPVAEMSLTIEQCRAMALRNNLSLKVQQFNPMIAEENIIQAQAQFEPLALDSINYSKTDQPILSRSTDASQGNSLSNSLRLQIPLRTGGSVTLSQPLFRSETDNEFSILPISYSTDLSFSLNQPLLRGGGIHTNEYNLRVAHYGSEMSKAQTKLQAIMVLASVDRAYWRLYAARKELEVRKMEYDLATAQLESSRRKFEAGEVIELDVILAEDAATQRLEGIILAENSARDRERELKQTLNEAGLEMETPTILVSATEPVPVRYEVDTTGLLDYALENRMEMMELELQLLQDADTIAIQKNAALPLLSLSYTYNVNALGETVDDSYDLMWRNRFVDHRLGLDLQVPLGNQAADSRLRQSVLRRQQRLMIKKDREITVKREVLNAIDQMEANWQRIIASRQSSILAARTLAAEQRQYDLGRLILTELLDAQTRYASALLTELRALVEYQISQVDLAYSVGALLTATRVEFETEMNDEF